MDNFSKEVLKHIKSFNADIKNSKLNSNNLLDKYFENLDIIYEESMANLESLNSINIGIENSNAIINETYKAQLAKLNNTLYYETGLIKSMSVYQVNGYQELIQKEEKYTNSTLKSNNDNKLLTTSSTNPVIGSHFTERNTKIEIEKHIKKTVNNRYDEFVNKFTDQRDQRILDISRNNNIFMNSYEQASNNVIKSFNDEITIHQKNIDAIDEKIERLKSGYNSDCLELERRFNKEVVAYQSEAKSKIKLFTAKYNEDRTVINDRRDEQRNKNTDERSAVFKEFVQQIHSLNDKLDKFNQDQKAHLYDSTLIFNLKIFDYDKKIRLLQEENHRITDKKKISLNNKSIKEMEKIKRTENMALKLKSEAINKFYKPRVLDYSNRKNIFEDIKNRQLEKLNFISDIEDNAYHNKLAILQIQYDNNIDSINREVERKVHKLRTSFDMEHIKLTRDFKSNLLDLYIEKQNVLNSLKLIENERELAKDLNISVKNNAKKVLDNKISKVSTEALLEIEKNNLLREYNNFNINNKIEHEKILYNYKEQNEFLLRDKRNTSVDFASNHSKVTLTHNRAVYSYNIELETLKEEFLNNIKTTKNLELTAVASANNAYSLFKNRKKILNATYNEIKIILTRIIKNVEALVSQATSKLISYSETSSYKYTLREIITKTNLLCTKIANTTEEFALSVLTDQINYETGNKYQTRYNSLQAEYDSKIGFLRARKKDLDKTIDNYNKTNQIFYNNLGVVQTKLSSFVSQLKRDEITKSVYRNETYGLKAEVKRIHQLISKNDEKIEKLLVTSNKIPSKISSLIKENNKIKQRIQNEEKDESAILYEGMKDIHEYFNTLRKLFADISDSINGDINEYVKFIKRVDSATSAYVLKTPKIILQFIQLIERLDLKITNRYNKLINKNQISYDKEIKIITKTYERNKAYINQKIETENNKFADIIEDYNLNLDQEMKRYDELIESNKETYNRKEKELANKQKNAFAKYLIRADAARTNILENVVFHDKIDKQLSDENLLSNRELVKKYINLKDEILQNNDKKLQSFRLSKQNIPYEIRLEEKEAWDKLSDYLKAFDNEVKENDTKLLLERKNIESETRHYASKLQNKIGDCNQAISKGRKAIASRS